MKIAYLLYDEITLLDIVGPFTVFSCLPHYEAAWVSARPGPVSDHTRTTSLEPSVSLSDFTEPDIVVVPGGYGTSKHLDGPEVEWSSGIDLALTLLQELEGREAAEIAQLATEYDPEPPTDSGSPVNAKPEHVELVRSVMAPKV